MRQRWEFKLDFIKFYSDIKASNELSYSETLIYWFIRTVIENTKSENERRNNKNIPSCFCNSKTIAANIWVTEWTVNNCVKKLKDKWLIVVHNRYNKHTWHKSRVIYLPEMAPKEIYNEVDEFFDTNCRLLDFYGISYTLGNRAIIWDLIFNHGNSIKDIYKFLEDYEWTCEWTEILRDMYLPCSWLVEYQWEISRFR